MPFFLGKLNAPQRHQLSSAKDSNQSDASQSNFIEFTSSSVHGADDDNEAKLWGQAEYLAETERDRHIASGTTTEELISSRLTAQLKITPPEEEEW